MRKYIALLILSVFLFNIEGYYLLFCVLQYSIKKEVRQEIRKGLKDEDLTVIIMPENDEAGIIWLKPGKEFRYNDEMYDVVKIHYKHQKKYYHCITDKKEKQLIADFQKSHNSKSESEKKIKRTFTYNFYPQQFTYINNLYSIDYTFSILDVLYTSNAIDVLSPPPKTA